MRLSASLNVITTNVRQRHDTPPRQTSRELLLYACVFRYGMQQQQTCGRNQPTSLFTNKTKHLYLYVRTSTCIHSQYGTQKTTPRAFKNALSKNSNKSHPISVLTGTENTHFNSHLSNLSTNTSSSINVKIKNGRHRLAFAIAYRNDEMNILEIDAQLLLFN